MLHLQLGKQGTVAQTQIESLPDITVQVFKCYIYKNSNWHKMVEKHKTRKNQQTFYDCNMCNNTVKITFYCITTRKATKEIKNINSAVDGQRPANTHDRQIIGQTNFRSNFVILK